MAVAQISHYCFHRMSFNRPSPQGRCAAAKCRVTYCHTCYYADEHRQLPGDCDTCSYYPEVRQAVNRCFKRWAVCTRRANGRQYTKVTEIVVFNSPSNLLQ